MTKEENSEKTTKQVEEKRYLENGFSTPQKLIMYKDSKGKVQTMLMKIVADFDYFENSLKKSKKEKAKNNVKDFDGTVLFYNWEEAKIIEGLHYENGKLVRVFKPERITPKGRISGCTTWEYEEYVPCANLRTSGHSCSITYSISSCTVGGPESSLITVSMVSFNGTGGGGAAAISSSYRQNKVDNFLAQASQNGVTFNPDERLEFIDNFDDFLKIKDDLLNKIRAWKNGTTQWLEQEYNNAFAPYSIILTPQEKSILANNGPFASYRINLMLYTMNAQDATIDAGIIMTSLGRDGTKARNCGECRANAPKHAAWLIRNSYIFGTSTAQSLGVAHESITSGAAKDMDLHNNQVGLALYNQYGGDVLPAIYALRGVLQNGLPNNALSGLQFILPNTTTIKWAHQYPNND